MTDTARRIAIDAVSPEMIAVFGDTPCLIWSGEHGAWWRPDAAGYTTQYASAGRYTIAGAFAETEHCGPEKRIELERVAACPTCGSNLLEPVVIPNPRNER